MAAGPGCWLGSLRDRSGAPIRVHNRTSEQTIELLRALRRLRFTGPELAEVTGMPVSTIAGILKRIGIGRLGNIPGTMTDLPSGAGDDAGSGPPGGVVQVANDAQIRRHVGAAPPAGHGRHRLLPRRSCVGRTTGVTRCIGHGSVPQLQRPPPYPRTPRHGALVQGLVPADEAWRAHGPSGDGRQYPRRQQDECRGPAACARALCRCLRWLGLGRSHWRTGGGVGDARRADGVSVGRFAFVG